ncbi:MAG TPA: hypothetical protein VN613_04715, partial [Gemmatimonadaceae bacterium]|nr:hypothetical protein [Gemmatimonadaceae bacterium]
MSDPIQIITVSQGTPGAPGSQIYTGAGIPSPTLGGQGDFYLNVTNGDVYQKNLGTWGTPAGNIRGPQGIQGIQGPVGSQIYTGGGAPSSGQGVTGDFYLNTLNGDYYSRSGGGWGSPVGNLTGPQGPQGIQGPVGSQILTGTGAPSGLTGVNGDIYIDNSNGNYYKKVSGSWVLQGTLAANSMRFISGWNANTNTPTLASGMGGEGDAYLVTTAGTTTLDGLSSWEVNDVVFFTQGAWRKMAVNQQKLSDKGQANGYAGLDSGGKVPLSQLPSSVVGDVQYQGAWNASTNTPSLSSGVGTQGQYYVVSVAGTHTLDGISSWAVGDWAIFNGSVWQKVDNNNLVQSVNSKQGVVVLTTDDVAEGVTNEYFTTARAKAAAVEDAIVSGHHDTAPSGDSVATALAGKLPTGTTTDGIPEGSTNLYFTAGRAQTAAVENAINSGTTNKAPSEDAVFTALAGKQASGNYMTGTTGDVVSTGPGTVAATIQTGVVTDTKGALATKPACAVVATSNQSLSGLPTIDGVSVADGTLVLLSAQTSPSQNGPWIAHSGSWTRPTWFPTGGTTQAFQF